MRTATMTIAWLRDLEEKVKETSARLGKLQRENEKLEKKVAKLEAQLEAAPGADEAAAWAEERGDIRQRVEKLVDHLGDLLEG